MSHCQGYTEGEIKVPISQGIISAFLIMKIHISISQLSCLLTSQKLVDETLLDLAVLLSLLILLVRLLGALLVEVGLLLFGQLGALLTTQRHGVVRLVPGGRGDVTTVNIMPGLASVAGRPGGGSQY